MKKILILVLCMMLLFISIGANNVSAVNPATWTLRKRITGIIDTTDAISGVAFSPDGKWYAYGITLYSGDDEGHLIICNATTNATIVIKDTGVSDKGSATVRFSPDSDYLIWSHSAIDKVQIFHTGNWSLKTTLTNTSNAVWDISSSYFVMGGKSNNDGTFVYTYPDFDFVQEYVTFNFVTDVKYSSSLNKWAVASNTNNKIYFINTSDFATGSYHKIITTGSSRTPSSIAWKGNRLYYTSTDDKKLRYVNLDDWSYMNIYHDIKSQPTSSGGMFFDNSNEFLSIATTTGIKIYRYNILINNMSYSYPHTINAITIFGSYIYDDNDNAIGCCWSSYDNMDETQHEINFYSSTSLFSEEGVEEEETTGNYSFYLNFYDIETNDEIKYIGYLVSTGIPDAPFTTSGYAKPKIRSPSLWSGGYKPSYNGYNDDSLEIATEFTDGQSYTFIFSGDLTDITPFFGIRKNEFSGLFYKEKTITLTLYAGQTYNIYLEPTWYIDGVTYNHCKDGDDSSYICLNKDTYDFGETVRCEYVMPSGAWLNANGYLTHGWEIRIYNRDDYFIGLIWSNTPFVHRFKQDDGEILFDGNRHTLEWTIKEFNSYGYDEYFNDYEIVVFNPDAFLGINGWILDNFIFYCNGDEFIPEGNITSVTPNPAYFGQDVTISWTSNGQGQLEIVHGSYSNTSRNVFFRTTYGYSEGVHTITKQMTAIGTFYINLYVDSSSINDTLPDDTAVLTVNPLGTNGSYGSMSYGVAYLYIPMPRVIAGLDTLQIGYRSYKNDSQLIITSPRGEITWFSTTVDNVSDNILEIPVESYMQIGTWNVTLYGGHINGTSVILRSSFNVVNEEGNWIEFGKNVFYDNEQFTVYVKHTYRVALTFYKNDIAQGENMILQINEYDNDKLTIPYSFAKPSYGNWRVEMWRINDRNRVYELAEWDCRVVSAPSEIAVDTTGTVIFPTIGQPLGSIVGMIITVVSLLLPFMVSAGLHMKQNLHPVIFAFSGAIGISISTVLGLFPSWLPIFLVIVGIIVIVITFLLKNNQSGGE